MLRAPYRYCLYKSMVRHQRAFSGGRPSWIPDFVIIEAESVYVEVKPIDKVPPDRDVMDKIDQSGCDKEVLIVGITVPIQDGLIGWLRQDLSDVIGSDESHWAWAGAVVGVWVGSETTNELGENPERKP